MTRDTGKASIARDLFPHEQTVPASRRAVLDHPPNLRSSEPVRAEAALLREKEPQEAAGAVRVDAEPLREEDRGRGAELVERDAAGVIILGGSAIGEVGSCEGSVNRPEAQRQPLHPPLRISGRV